jgi:NAD(P)-dependent dehydrogenase (short-subunit alcohol dehydrogenase family)
VRSVTAGEEAVRELRELGVTARPEFFELDITSTKHIRAAVEAIATRFGRLDGQCLLTSPTAP